MAGRRHCPMCGRSMAWYSSLCTACKDWTKQPGGRPGNRAIRAAQVADRIARGMTKPQIAAELGISRSYVGQLILDPDGSKLAASRAGKPHYSDRDVLAARRRRKYLREWEEHNLRVRVRQSPALSAVESRYFDRQEIIDRDGSRCHICGKKVLRDVTLDHLIPLSRGGSHTAENLAVAHRSCNAKRGAGRIPAQLRLIA